MNAKDKKIIESNPGKSLYDLIKLGLSQSGAAEWGNKVSQLKPSPEILPKTDPNQLIPQIVQPTASHKAIPQLSAQLPGQSADGMVKVLNKTTGNLKPMLRNAAELLVRKTPHLYSIVG